MEDDGVGFDTARMADDGRLHVGIANVRARMGMLVGGTLSVESAPGAGTRATLRVPKAEEGCGGSESSARGTVSAEAARLTGRRAKGGRVR
ncbi:hypothetical protein [Gordonibacter sp. An230]|uniref:hypothetical protein n=1 Tax=Gordonibacter sp. An230 TaxID=1965592 RepID=UPI0031453205